MHVPNGHFLFNLKIRNEKKKRIIFNFKLLSRSENNLKLMIYKLQSISNVLKLIM